MSDMQDDEMQTEQPQEEQQLQRPRVVISTRHGAGGGGDAASSVSSFSTGNNRQISLKTKGRGFKAQFSQEDRYGGKSGDFESLEEEEEVGIDAQKSVEGYIVIVTNLHEETNEDDLYEMFADYGEVKALTMSLDRRTGYVKGYALIEFPTYKEASSAISALNGELLHEKALNVDWALRPAVQKHRGRGPRSQGRGPRS